MNYTEKFNNAYAELEKAIKDRSHLTQKVITDKNGHTRKVWINPLDKEQMKQKKIDKENLTDFTGKENEKKLIQDAVKEAIGTSDIKMKTFDHKDATFYMIQMNLSDVKSPSAKAKITDALKSKGINPEQVLDSAQKERWEYSEKIPAKYQITFHVTKDSKSNNKIKKEYSDKDSNISESKVMETFNKIWDKQPSGAANIDIAEITQKMGISPKDESKVVEILKNNPNVVVDKYFDRNMVHPKTNK